MPNARIAGCLPAGSRLRPSPWQGIQPGAGWLWLSYSAFETIGYPCPPAVLLSPWTDLTGSGASVRENDGKCAMFRPENMGGTFQLGGQEFFALNGGPQFTFSPAISFFVNCETQQEVDELWEKLSEGGEKQRCGWLKDKYGVSWQTVPSVLGEMLQDQDGEKSKRVMKALLQMGKIDIGGLEKAYEGR